MNLAEYKKANRDTLKANGYRLLPERWIKASEYDISLKWLKELGAVAGAKDIK